MSTGIPKPTRDLGQAEQDIRDAGVCMVVMEGRLWHKTGWNRTPDERRGAIFACYTLPIYRTQENWFLSLDPTERLHASDTLPTLLGYKA
ncbi:MAG TPA: hypothetical protein VKF60_14890 [Myxococcota bacterium]|nr:hypothetical protein [Myxococcota bacterium]